MSTDRAVTPDRGVHCARTGLGYDPTGCKYGSTCKCILHSSANTQPGQLGTHKHMYALCTGVHAPKPFGQPRIERETYKRVRAGT